MPDANTSPTTSRRRTDRQGQELPQLSCDLCRERKVKCDKLDPCTNCTQAGVSCVTIFRNRLPRGRYANRAANNGDASTATTKARNATKSTSPTRQPASLTAAATAQSTASKRARGASNAQANKELRQRIQRLESIVQSQGLEPSNADASRRNSLTQHVQATVNQDDSLSMNIDSMNFSPGFPFSAPGSQPRYMPMWTDFTEEPPLQDPQFQSQFRDMFSFDALEFARSPSVDSGLGPLGTHDAAKPSRDWMAENPALMAQLCHVFLAQVDPIIKILHRPSVERWLIQGDTYFHYASGHATVQALGTAIAFMAASSMTERQCSEAFQMNRQQLVDETCKACEGALAGAGLLATQDITVLQAFVLFLVAKRCQDRSLAIWTIISLAVRIGQNLGIDNNRNGDGGRIPTFFEQQMHKRLWLTICSLDYQTALLQGSPPMIKHESIRIALGGLSHINDSDFGPATTQPMQDREELTEMTFAYVLFHLQLSGRLLNYTEVCSSFRDHDNDNTRLDEFRRKHAREFEEKALGALRFCDPESSSLAWFTWHGTQCFVAAIRSWTLRPLPQGPPAAQLAILQTEFDNPELFRTLLKVLEKNYMVHTDMRGEGFRWHAVVPWPILATAIAEFCSCGDTALLQRAWPIIESSYQHQKHISIQVGEDVSQTVLSQLMDRANTKLTGSPSTGSSLRQSTPFSTGSVHVSPLSTALSSTDSIFDANVMAMAIDQPIYGHTFISTADGNAQYFHHSVDSGTFIPDMRLLSDNTKSHHGMRPDGMHTGRHTSDNAGFANIFR